jgi:LPS export ABC transporter protein LptC
MWKTICALGLGLLLAACGGNTPAPTLVEEQADGSQRTYQMNLKLTEGGVLKADLYGDTAFQRPGTQLFEVRGVKLVFNSDDGGKPGELTAETGEYDERTGIMVARGNVVLITFNERGERRVVRSEELHYDQRGDRVWSEQETTVEEVDRTLITRGFESDTRFTEIRGRDSRSGDIRVNAGAGGL